MTLTDDAGDMFCHAELRVCGTAIARRWAEDCGKSAVCDVVATLGKTRRWRVFIAFSLRWQTFG
jgi:hypothetical protein